MTYYEHITNLKLEDLATLLWAFRIAPPNDAWSREEMIKFLESEVKK